jgi:peptide/nickel transport system permease protein
MAAYTLRRLWQMVPTILGVVLLVFVLFKAFGGDPAEILGGQNATPEQIAAIRQQLGLDEPIWYQLWLYLKSVVTFDWGVSWATREPVSQLFATRLPATLTVMLPILVLDTLLALPIAMWVAYRRGSLSDRAITVITTLALSISFSSTSSSGSMSSVSSWAGSRSRAGATASSRTWPSTHRCRCCSPSWSASRRRPASTAASSSTS